MTTHPLSEKFPWTIAVVDHPPRTDSAAYRASRTLMHKIIATVPDWVLGTGPYEDHHGGSLWLKDADGWVFVQLPLGIEWSAQFCADPAKVDKLRLNAQRILTAFPLTLPGYLDLGYHTAAALLATPITTMDQVSLWTDSIFNASMPLSAHTHSGILPHAAGYHHYPKPIVDIDHFRRDDFTLFVTDPQGLTAVVVPMSADPADRRVRLLGAHPDSEYANRLLRSPAHHTLRAVGPEAPEAAQLLGTPAPHSHVVDSGATILEQDDPLARQAYRRVSH